MRSISFRWTYGLTAMLVFGACEDSSVEGLKGRWTGLIKCATERSDIKMSLQVHGERITGDAITRTKEINTDWRIEGAQEELHRNTRCRDDTCETDKDCVGRGDGTCSQYGICEPCEEREMWRRVFLTLIDIDVESTDPVMTVERFGDERLTGTIKSFCSDEELVTPSVELDKE